MCLNKHYSHHGYCQVQQLSVPVAVEVVSPVMGLVLRMVVASWHFLNAPPSREQQRHRVYLVTGNGL